MRTAPDINVQCAGGQSLTPRILNSGIVQNAAGIMNIARIIYFHIFM